MNAKIDNALSDLAEDQIAMLKKGLLAKGKFASGNLFNSLGYRIKESGGKFQIEIYGAPYLINVDRGRAAGKTPPPIAPIMKWIKDKRIAVTQESAMAARRGDTRQDNKPRAAKRGRGAASDAAVKSAAIAISKSIGARGIPPYGRGSLVLKDVGIRSQNSKKAITNITQNLIKNKLKELNLTATVQK